MPGNRKYWLQSNMPIKYENICVMGWELEIGLL